MANVKGITFFPWETVDNQVDGADTEASIRKWQRVIGTLHKLHNLEPLLRLAEHAIVVFNSNRFLNITLDKLEEDAGGTSDIQSFC